MRVLRMLEALPLPFPPFPPLAEAFTPHRFPLYWQMTSSGSRPSNRAVRLHDPQAGVPASQRTFRACEGKVGLAAILCGLRSRRTLQDTHASPLERGWCCWMCLPAVVAPRLEAAGMVRDRTRRALRIESGGIVGKALEVVRERILVRQELESRTAKANLRAERLLSR